MKIIHAANFDLRKNGAVFYACDRKISNGMTRNGHHVYDFSYRDVARNNRQWGSKKSGIKNMNQLFIDTVDNIRPDFIMLGHSELISLETLQHIKQNHPDTHIAQWYVDPLFSREKLGFIIDRMVILDALFCTTGGEHLDMFKQKGGKAFYLPNPVDDSIEVFHNDEKTTFEYDLIFCGRDKNEKERGSFLQHLTDQLDQLRIGLRGSLGNPLVYGHGYLDLLEGSKMGLNLSRSDEYYMYSSDRIAQLTGNGLLTFTPETPGIRKLYNDDEMIFFSGLDELIDKARYYHQHDEERCRIAANGRRRAHQCYNSTRLAKYMLELSLAEGASENYEWMDS